MGRTAFRPQTPRVVRHPFENSLKCNQAVREPKNARRMFCNWCKSLIAQAGRPGIELQKPANRRPIPGLPAWAIKEPLCRTPTEKQVPNAQLLCPICQLWFYSSPTRSFDFAEYGCAQDISFTSHISPTAAAPNPPMIHSTICPASIGTRFIVEHFIDL